MSSNKSSRRVKNKRISRPFLLGTEAWKLSPAELKNPKIQPGATSGWRVYLRPIPNGPALSTWLKKVVFLLHETFPNASRTVEAVNPATGGFELEETAYGGFLINVKMYFDTRSGEKWTQRACFLQLDPYSGDPDPEKAEAERAAMAKANLVRAETVEVIEFNEPNEALFDALTADTQWDYLKSAKAKSKGKTKAQARLSEYPPPPGAQYTAGEGTPGFLPDRPLDQGHIWSKETEDLLVKQLQKAGEEADRALEKTAQRHKEVLEFSTKMREGVEVDDKIRALWERLPQKKK